MVILAQEEARSLKHNDIGTEHILLALLREEEGLAARVLESLGVTIAPVRARVLRIARSGDEVASGRIPFTARAQKVREFAQREASILEHEYIGTEHILLGLVREDDGATSILLEFDADADAIRKEVIRTLSGSAGRRSQPEGETAAADMHLEARRAALLRANEIRAARARLTRELRSGSMDVAELIRDPPPEVLTAKVADLLCAARRSGRVRTQRALTHARISPSKTVGGLTERQRRELLDYLHPPSPHT